MTAGKTSFVASAALLVFIRSLILCAKLFDAANEYYSLPTWNIVHFYFFLLLGNSSLFTKIILCFPRKLFADASRVSETILRGLRKLFFAHMKIYVFSLCFKVWFYLICNVLSCVVLWIVLPVLPCVLCRVLSHHHAAGYNVK